VLNCPSGRALRATELWRGTAASPMPLATLSLTTSLGRVSVTMESGLEGNRGCALSYLCGRIVAENKKDSYGLAANSCCYTWPYSNVMKSLPPIPTEVPPDAPRTQSFPGETSLILREKETEQFGEYRTKRLVLEAWERLQKGRN
jgi:hypothetical protein